MQEIQLLSKKLDELLEKYRSVKAENKRLNATIAEQLKIMEKQNNRLLQVEERLAAVQLGEVVDDEQEKQGLRKELDKAIADIDKILQTLDD